MSSSAASGVFTRRARTWQILEGFRRHDPIGHRVQVAMLWLIGFNVLAVVFESVDSIGTRYQVLFNAFEVFSVLVFTVEYLARVWSCPEDPRYQHPVWGRLRFVCSPMAVVDLIAFLPFYITFVDVDLRFVRAFRLVRLARVAKLGRYSEASGMLLRVLHSKREELFLTMSLLMTLAIVFATLMYYVEGDVQPDKFPNIPAALWWSIVTITTVGYGDVYPVTPLGKVIGVITTLLGLLMIALPTGVFGAAFVQELDRQKQEKKTCPHCGKAID